MRRTRPLLVAAVLVLLAAGIGTTIALTTRRAPAPAAAAAAAEEPAGLPVAAAPSGPTASTTPPDTTPPSDTPPGGDARAAVTAARAFLARELGMTDLVALPFRSVDARTGEVGFRHRHGEGGSLLPQTGPPAVTVRLYRLPAGWWVLGVQGRTIRVDSPARLRRIGSPLTVSGKADVYEGTVSVKITQDRPGRDLVLGEGFVTGPGPQPGAFRGQVGFREPSGTAPGWVILYEDSAATGGGIVQATAVRVRFAFPTPAPRIQSVTSRPRLRVLEGGWQELPDGAGTVVLSVQASDTHRVRFVLTPTGTGTGPYGRLLGEDHDPRDGFSLTWRYPDQALSAHLTIQATGPGGTTEKLLDVVHP
jgi:Immunoglobulin-like domain of bacterial spore germination